MRELQTWAIANLIMPSVPVIYSYHFSTRSRTMVIVGLAAAAFALLFSLPTAFDIGRVRRGEPVSFGGLALLVFLTSFSLWAVYGVIRDWRYPKSYGLELTDTTLRWFAREDDLSVELAEITRVDIAGRDDHPLLSITTRDGRRLHIHPNSVGPLKEFSILLREALPNVTFRDDPF